MILFSCLYRSSDSLNCFSLIVPIHSNPDVDLESQSTSIDHFVPPCRLTDSVNGANGFMLISDTGEDEKMSNQMKVNMALY